MRGLTFHGNGDVRVEEVPDASIEQPTDAVVRVTMAAICGSDLHVLQSGEAFGFAPGARLGHEFIGVVEEVGSDVHTVSPGDRVAVAAGVSCGDCVYCQEGKRDACTRMSMFGWAPRLWRHGGDVQGGQSQFARVPLADSTLFRVPDEIASPERQATLLPLVDVMSTGWHGLISGGAGPGCDVAVIGDGAVGLSAVHCARAIGARSIICMGHHDDRLTLALRLGATHTVTTRNPDEIRELVREATDGHGAHVVVDTISSEASMQGAHAAVRAGGSIACLGMDHFKGQVPAINWYDQFVRNITVTGGLIPMGHYIPALMGLAARGEVDPAPMLTTRLGLDDAPEGYRMMAGRAPGVLKVALEFG